jgi:hypothetical protein
MTLSIMLIMIGKSNFKKNLKKLTKNLLTILKCVESMVRSAKFLVLIEVAKFPRLSRSFPIYRSGMKSWK